MPPTASHEEEEEEEKEEELEEEEEQEDEQEDEQDEQEDEQLISEYEEVEDQQLSEPETAVVEEVEEDESTRETEEKQSSERGLPATQPRKALGDITNTAKSSTAAPVKQPLHATGRTKQLPKTNRSIKPVASSSSSSSSSPALSLSATDYPHDGASVKRRVGRPAGKRGRDTAAERRSEKQAAAAAAVAAAAEEEVVEEQQAVVEPPSKRGRGRGRGSGRVTRSNISDSLPTIRAPGSEGMRAPSDLNGEMEERVENPPNQNKQKVERVARNQYNHK